MNISNEIFSIKNYFSENIPLFKFNCVQLLAKHFYQMGKCFCKDFAEFWLEFEQWFIFINIIRYSQYRFFLIQSLANRNSFFYILIR